jgi:hypothetical protein
MSNTEFIVRAARKEEADLLAQLEDNPLYRRLMAVRALLAVYASAEPPRPQRLVDVAREMLEEANRNRHALRLDALRARSPSINSMTDAAAHILRNAGRPVPRKDLFDALVAQGFDIGGKVPMNTLSARLHNSGLFQGTPEGYVLREYPEKTEATDGESVASENDRLSQSVPTHSSTTEGR